MFPLGLKAENMGMEPRAAPVPVMAAADNSYADHFDIPFPVEF